MSKSKKFRVDACNEFACPCHEYSARALFGSYSHWCSKSGRSLEGKSKIPEDCPLKDWPDVDEEKRTKALMILIHQMIAEYQNFNRGFLSEDIFKLFEKAKKINFAKDNESLAKAIKEI